MCECLNVLLLREVPLAPYPTISCISLLPSESCLFRGRRLQRDRISNPLPRRSHQSNIQHPHCRWQCLWAWRVLLHWIGDPPGSSGYWCHERQLIYGQCHHYKWWVWVFSADVPQSPSVTYPSACKCSLQHSFTHAMNSRFSFFSKCTYLVSLLWLSCLHY